MKVFFKTIFAIAALALLVWTAMHNDTSATLDLPNILPKPIKQPAAYLYVGFFAVGLITGAILNGGNGKKGPSGTAPAKPSKPKLIK